VTTTTPTPTPRRANRACNMSHSVCAKAMGVWLLRGDWGVSGSDAILTRSIVFSQINSRFNRPCLVALTHHDNCRRRAPIRFACENPSHTARVSYCVVHAFLQRCRCACMCRRNGSSAFSSTSQNTVPLSPRLIDAKQTQLTPSCSLTPPYTLSHTHLPNPPTLTCILFHSSSRAAHALDIVSSAPCCVIVEGVFFQSLSDTRQPFS
jgi:hypothetical protein